MTGDTKEAIYNPGDVADLLNVKESTLRKYSLLLEKYGYTFHKNERGQRGYFDSDIVVLRRMTDLKNGGMTLEKAALSAATWGKSIKKTVGDTALQRYDERHTDEINELKEMIQQQNELIKTLTERLDEQQKYIEERLNKRDEMLMQVLRSHQQETQRLITAAREENLPWYKKIFKK